MVEAVAWNHLWLLFVEWILFLEIHGLGKIRVMVGYGFA
jgi:hypothetical protein